MNRNFFGFALLLSGVVACGDSVSTTGDGGGNSGGGNTGGSTTNGVSDGGNQSTGGSQPNGGGTSDGGGSPTLFTHCLDVCEYDAQNCSSEGGGGVGGGGAGGAPPQDCNADCTDALDLVEHVGCSSQYDAILTCVEQARNPCEASCDQQAEVFVDCFNAFCDANPDDSACSDT